ncbi:outer membrane protein with beta-barrel domain [Lutibacter sp. Hel_I_33_5]|uniref:porin family protein n=1 Tax=Lutibacter sp. Hel_I_33_5 TaxID=1566289 RepID=UPI0011AA4C43|nr:porin family protein [Lutibacter sp. Hel_I_33_5]TVZ54952.1 outer membrane protein with beta-barrel domain [Lutibacter sp. Hel_I_33_5]
MKKVVFVFCLFLAGTQFSNAQLQWGLKGGLNYNSDSFTNVKNDVLAGAGSETGYHAGLWFRGRIPIVGLSIRPELVYTQISNKVAFAPATGIANTTFDLKKIDIPVLLEKGILKFGRVFAGPSFQYIVNSGFGLNTLGDVDVNDFTVGIQLGAGVEFGKLGVDVRWERGFSGIESVIAGNTLGNNISFDTRVNQIIVSLSVKL